MIDDPERSISCPRISATWTAEADPRACAEDHDAGHPDFDCFTFGVMQDADHFTVYASVDHLHIDGMSAGLIFVDIHLMYQHLSQGQPTTFPEIGGYREYAARQRENVQA